MQKELYPVLKHVKATFSRQLIFLRLTDFYGKNALSGFRKLTDVRLGKEKFCQMG